MAGTSPPHWGHVTLPADGSFSVMSGLARRWR
jgi:hypothetical protein